MIKKKKKINWFSLMIMILGIVIAIFSAITNGDLAFVGGALFGVGMSNLL